MKKQLFRLLIVGLLINSSSAMAMSALEVAIEDYNQEMTEQDLMSAELSNLTDEQYEQLMSIRESGGDVFNQHIPQISKINETQKSILEMDKVQDISAISNISELQADAQKRTQGRGKWAYHLVYLGNDGKRIELSAARINEQVRPASTMKVMSSYLAFTAGTYPLSKMSDMLHRSDNGMADEAFRTVSRNKSGYVLPSNHYAQSLIGYKIRDGAAGVKRVIDRDIARSCGLAKDSYSTTEDSGKFHIINGSGLQDSAVDKGNAVNKVSVRFQTALLEKIARSGRYNEYKRLLAQPGQSGTLLRRLAQTNQMGKVYAKTGTLAAVIALAGYVDTKNGKLVFSIIGDDLTVGTAVAKSEIDNILFQHVKYLTTRGL